MQWGAMLFTTSKESDECEATLIDVGFLTHGERAAWEDQVRLALTAVRNNVSTMMSYIPFMLHHAWPARHMIGCIVDGTVDPSWGDHLQQVTVMAQAARATAASHHYNRQ